MLKERTIRVRRVRTASVFRIAAVGTFGTMVPFALLMGVFALFGAETIRWNDRAITGVPGLLLSPIFGAILAAVFSVLGGLHLTVGLWLYSKFFPLELRVLEEQPRRRERVAPQPAS